MNCQQCNTVLQAGSKFCPQCGAPVVLSSVQRVSIPPEIAERATNLAGRLWVLDEVIDWLDHGAERFFLFTGEPGSGKTALAAWLAGAGPVPEDTDARKKLELVRSGWRAVHFCNARGKGGTLDPKQFTDDLAGQLSEFYGEFGSVVLRHVAPETVVDQKVEQNWGQIIGVKIVNFILNNRPQDGYNQVIRQPLRTLLKEKSGLRVFILVDGLDEANTVEAPNIVTLLTGSDDFPAGVRFLLTSRNEQKVISQFDNLRRLNLSDPKFAVEVRKDLTQYVDTRLKEPELQKCVTTPGTPSNFKERIINKADGNFLYTEFLLNEIAKGLRPPDDLDDLPHQIPGLYRKFLERLLPSMLQPESSPKWTRRFQPLLGCMSVASPAAPEECLPRWMKRSAGEVSALLNDIDQLTEWDPGDEGGYRLFHLSLADFLSNRRYQVNGSSERNPYYTPVAEQHDRIIKYYLSNFSNKDQNWSDCDRYGLRQLVSHLQARLEQAETEVERRKLVQSLYQVVLNEQFRAAQQMKLGDLYVTFMDLRMVLQIALERNDLVKALECAAIYRHTKHSLTISKAIFQAVAKKDFGLALHRSKHYQVLPKMRSNWERSLQLYLAWEAAQQSDTQAVYEIMESAEPFTLGASGWVEQFNDALLAHLAHTLSGIPGNGMQARDWVQKFIPDQDPEWRLNQYTLAQPLDPRRQDHLLSSLQAQLAEFERLVGEGDPEATSNRPFLDEEAVGHHAAGLRGLLVELAATNEGRAAIDKSLNLVLPNPYPRYRDIGLVALGIACLAVPDPDWTRPRLQSIIETALNQEGVTYAFDLPAILLEEARKRKLPAQKLTDYLETALNSNNGWGTSMRAHSARAAALFWQGKEQEAFDTLQTAGCQETGYAGYGVMTLLSLANRCYEFGKPAKPAEPIWGSAQNISLLDGAWGLAANVRDEQFRKEREQLVQEYVSWSAVNPLDTDAALSALSKTSDPDMRRAYKDFASALWANQGNLDGIKKFVPITLANATSLDLILGRLFGHSLSKLKVADLAEAIRLCATYLLTEIPGA
jgi:hypothetical protein